MYTAFRGDDYMDATILKANDEYILHLPNALIKDASFSENEPVQVFAESGRIIIQSNILKFKVRDNDETGTATIANVSNRKTIEELFEGYEGDYVPTEIDWGEPVGNEVW